MDSKASRRLGFGAILPTRPADGAARQGTRPKLAAKELCMSKVSRGSLYSQPTSVQPTKGSDPPKAELALQACFAVQPAASHAHLIDL